MKKSILLLLSVLLVIGLSGCKESKDNEEPMTEELPSVSSENEQPSLSDAYGEGYSFCSELRDPDFKVAYNFDDCEKYLEFDESEITKEYDEKNRLAGETVYESDGKTKKASTRYCYDDELSYDVTLYLNGEESDKYKFNFAKDKHLESIFCNKNMQEGTAQIELYQFDSDGNVTQYMNSDEFHNIMLDAIFGALAGKGEEAIDFSGFLN